MAQVNNSLTKQEVNRKTLQSFVMSMKGEIGKALPSVLTPERFTRMALTAISNNEDLQNCTPESFIGALMNCAQLGLEPNTPLGQAYLIPYGGKVQMQIGFKGLLDLAYRNENMQNIGAQIVYENDEFEYELGLEPKLTHKPTSGERGAMTHVYAYYKLTNGGFGFEVMSKHDVDKHMKQYSKTYNKGPWQTDYEAMAKKTVLKKVLKYAPIKSDFATMVSEDESVKSISKENLVKDLQMSEIKNEVFDAETGEIVNE